MKKRLFTLCLALTAMCASTMAQVEINETNFPDAKFRSLVSKNIDTNKNGKLDESEINADAAKELIVSNQGIKDLTGIEHFTKLESLYCYGNEISGANMYKLVNLLPAPSSTLGGLIINYNGCTPDNVITKAQAKIAEEKGWLVVRCLNDEDFELYDGEDLTITAKFFPDAKFRGFVTVYDTDNDNILSDTDLGKVNEIKVNGKGITDLTGIEHFYNLLTLNCSNNGLTALDVWNNKYLETLDCSNNNLTALSFSNNQDLAWLACYGNNISGTAIDRLVASLPQIRPDADDYGFLIVCNDQCACDNTITTAQIMTAMGKDWRAWQYVGSDFTNMLIKISTAFDSDANFRAYVTSNFDTDGDGYLSMDERKAVKTLDVSEKSISNLSDVKYFTDLVYLYCTNNNLTKLDVGANKKLKKLYCGGNDLTSLDVSNNTELTELYCSNNKLTNLDVASNRNLKVLHCNYNSLKSLDVSNNTALTELHCHYNILQTLDVSKNTALTKLLCFGSSLTSLNVSGATALTKLECQNNSLQTLDVSNTALTKLNCYGNQINGAAMDKLVNGLPNTGGELYVCYKNATTDNVITVSQVRVATSKGWTVKRYESSSWVDYAGVFEPVAIDATNFPDVKFRNYLLAQDYGKDAVLTEDEMLAVTELNVRNKGIKDLTGIEHFAALTQLDCSNNSLESLDVSNNTALTVLYCSGNSLESLDVSNNTALTVLYCNGNSLESLDVSNNTALNELYCYSNSLESLDVSKNTALTQLDCYNNSLKSLDVSNNAALTELGCSSNSLESLDVSKNTALTDLDCSNNSLKSMDVSNNTALKRLWCNSNSLESLDVSMNTALKGLYCYNNNLSSLDVSKNTALKYLSCSGNQIKGNAMTNLVNSLPTLPSGTQGIMTVCDDVDRGSQDNIITASQVMVATNKRWKVYNGEREQYRAEYAGQGDVDRNNKINKEDLNMLVKIIMGQAPGSYYASDLNNDGKTDAADIVVMVNILKALGVK